MKRQVVLGLKILISAAILGILFWNIGINTIFTTLKQVNLLYLPAIIGFYFISIFIGAINVWLFIKALGKSISIRTLYKYMLLSWSIGLLTPGKVGDFSLAFLLEKHKITLGEGSAIMFMDKLLTLVVISIVAIIGFCFFFGIAQAVYVTTILLACMAGFSLILFFRKFLQKFFPKSYLIKFKKFFPTMKFFLVSRKTYVFVNVIITFIQWFLNALNVLLIFNALGTYTNPVYILVITMTLTLLNLIPFTYHGLGIKEAMGVYLYGLQGIAPDIVIVSSIVMNVIAYSISCMFVLLYLGEFKKVQQAS